MTTGKLFLNESAGEETLTVSNLLQELLKAKKQMRMYPSNNPIHINAFRKVFDNFQEILNLKDAVTLKISMKDIHFQDDTVYQKTERDDNLAFFFFKDGIREITFLNGLEQGEVEEFIRILNLDFERDAPDDDVATLLWESEFKHIKYELYETFDDESNPDSNDADNRNRISDEKVSAAYLDVISEEVHKPEVNIQLNDSDLRYFTSEMERQKKEKLEKVIIILFELLYQTTDPEDIRNTTRIIKDTIGYCIAKADYKKASAVIDMINSVIKDSRAGKECLKNMNILLSEINGKSFIDIIAKTINDLPETCRPDFISYIGLLDKRSIPYFINMMGDLYSIKGRHLAIDALVMLGPHDIKAVAKGLSDSRWYVVRNTVLILGKIAIPESVDYLIQAVEHADHRVRKEAVNAIGSLKGPDILIYLEKTLCDINRTVRIIAARTLGKMKDDDSRKLLVSEISKRSFSSKDYSEKKEFFRVLSKWNDSHTEDFMISILNRKSLFARSRNDENRACAAFALGLINARNSISILEKTAGSNNRQLREMSLNSLKKLKGN